MNRLQTHSVRYDLDLADGSHWEIAAGNEEAASIVSKFGYTMQLRMTPGIGETSANRRRLLVRVDVPASVADCNIPMASKKDGHLVSTLCPCEHWGSPYINLVRLSLIIAREAQTNGGVLIHGAFAELDGMGVILAAPGGTGKTTASNRLPPPWCSLCDDITLVIQDPQGNYWGHPWPTWSTFLDGGTGGAWNVQKAVPLKGIFFLTRAVADRTARIGHGRAVSLLVESARQASMNMEQNMPKDELRAMHLERFNKLYDLARVIPVQELHISLDGAFWREIEHALEEVRGGETINSKKIKMA